MRLTIHDVGLGQFVSLLRNDGSMELWDAGSSKNFCPGQYCREQGIERIQRLTITNFDQDHISGLPALRTSVKIRSLLRNRKADHAFIRNLKIQNPPITEAMESALQMHRDWNNPVSGGEPLDPPGIARSTFACSPSDGIDDTNNLSLVTVLEAGGMKFVISGDVERKGWEVLLENTSLALALRDTDVFIASHHGRENGYHEDVMSLASPGCVVMSDYEVKHATQETLGLYRRHCTGTVINGEVRRILTTRSDGTLHWSI